MLEELLWLGGDATDTDSFLRRLNVGDEGTGEHGVCSSNREAMAASTTKAGATRNGGIPRRRPVSIPIPSVEPF